MKRFPICIFFLVLLFAGCSSSGRVSSPDPNSPQSLPSIDTSPVFVSDRTPDGTPSEGMGLMGFFNLHVSLENTSLTPLRKTALEDVLEVVDITNFLTMAPCSKCVKIKSVSLDGTDHLVVSIGIKHPFPVGDPFKPITGKNRADLHVFNVEGIVLSNAAATEFPGSGEKVAGFKLLSADGYTGYLDVAIDEIYPTDATIHPYVLHFDDYTVGNFDAANPMGFASVTDPPPSGNLVMPMGCDYNYQDYVFDLAGIDGIDFLFAVGCTYALSSANKSQRFTPEYRVPQHNKKAASEVRIEVTRNEFVAGSTSSSADLVIKVLDINHGVPVGIALNEMRADSSVGSITIDIPGVLTGPFSVTPTPSGGDGRDPLNPLTFETTITNQAGADIGNYMGLVKVTDTYLPGQNGSPLLEGKDGIKRVDPLLTPLTGLFDINEFATYTMFEIGVSSSNLPPFVELLTECETVYSGGWTLLSVGPGTYDPDGNNLVLYEYDFDYDGVTFDVEASNTTGVSITTPPLVNTTPDPVVRTCALRVTDDGIPSAKGIGTVDITVHPINSNGKNIPIRPGEPVQARDLGVNETTGEIIIGFSDSQVWKYSPDYSSGSMWFNINNPPNTYNLKRLDIAKNGYSLIRSDSPEWTVCYDNNGLRYWTWTQGITTTAGITNLDGTWTACCETVDNNLVMLTNWPVYSTGDNRWFQQTHNIYRQLCGYLTTNFEGVGGFDVEFTKGFDAKRNISQVWVLEGDPRYELELFTFVFNYQGKTIGQNGARTDALDGFNDPRDVVLDINDRIYVLEKLSTGIPAIKLYDASGNPVAIFGTCGEIGGEPIAIDADEGDGEIHVLHTGGVSVFYPSEIP